MQQQTNVRLLRRVVEPPPRRDEEVTLPQARRVQGLSGRGWALLAVAIAAGAVFGAVLGWLLGGGG